MQNREELLQNIRPDMKLTKDFFKRVYGYEISSPGFAEQAIAALEAAGCSRARQYYADWVNTYKSAYEAEIKAVSIWYGEELQRKWDKSQREVSKTRSQKIQSLTRNELTELCQTLLAEGVITDPGQFVTAVLQEC